MLQHREHRVPPLALQNQPSSRCCEMALIRTGATLQLQALLIKVLLQFYSLGFAAGARLVTAPVAATSHSLTTYSQIPVLTGAHSAQHSTHASATGQFCPYG